MTDEEKTDKHFISLIFSLASAVMFQLGKIANPVTGKIEKNLNEAKVSIDMILMLREKTRGNLIQKEERLLTDTIADLQMNYVDEVKKEEGKEKRNDGETGGEKK